MSKAVTSNIFSDNRAFGYVNVKDYGAIGDGVNDDTAEIQAALDAAFDQGGYAVYFPVGTYRTSSTLNVKGPIFGANSGRQLYRFSKTLPDMATNNQGLTIFLPQITNGTPCLKLDGDAIKAVSPDNEGGEQGRINTVWRDFCIFGANLGNDGIKLQGSIAGGGTYKWTFERIQISDCDIGFDLWGWSGMLLHCQAMHCRENALVALQNNVLNIIGGEYGLGAYSDESPVQAVDKWIMRIEGGSGACTNLNGVTIQNSGQNGTANNNGVAISEKHANISLHNCWFEWGGHGSNNQRVLEIGGQDLTSSPTTPSNTPEDGVDSVYIEGCHFDTGSTVYLGNIERAVLVPNQNVSGVHLEISEYCKEIIGGLHRGHDHGNTAAAVHPINTVTSMNPYYGTPVQNLVLNPTFTGSYTSNTAIRGNWEKASMQGTATGYYDSNFGRRTGEGSLRLQVAKGVTATTEGIRMYFSEGTSNWLDANAFDNEIVCSFWYYLEQDLDASPDPLGAVWGPINITSMTHDNGSPTAQYTVTCETDHHLVAGSEIQIHYSDDFPSTTQTVLASGLTATEFKFDLAGGNQYTTPNIPESHYPYLVLDRRYRPEVQIASIVDGSIKTHASSFTYGRGLSVNKWSHMIFRLRDLPNTWSPGTPGGDWEIRIRPIGTQQTPPTGGIPGICNMFITDLFFGVGVSDIMAVQEGRWITHPAAGIWHGENIEVFANTPQTDAEVMHLTGDRVTRILSDGTDGWWNMGWISISSTNPGSFFPYGEYHSFPTTMNSGGTLTSADSGGFYKISTTASGNATFTLPTANTGLSFAFQNGNDDGYTITIDTDGTDFIGSDRSSPPQSLSLPNGSYVRIVAYTALEWTIVAQGGTINYV